QATPTTQRFTVDTEAPDVSITGGPDVQHPTNDPTPTFSFTSADNTATFLCAVDGPAYTACSAAGADTTPALSDGDHVFHVEATDPAGNHSFAQQSFTVDTQAPGLAFVSGPSIFTNDATATFVFYSTSTAVTFECAMDSPT